MTASSESRLCIVNADDFGLTSEINEGIIEAYKRGVVTATSLVATGEAFSQAILLLRENPGLDVGVHLTLVGEKPVLPGISVPSLVDESGSFRYSVFQFLLDYLRGKISLIDVEKEFRAQIEKLTDSGISISHMDSHQHVHMFPKILKVCIKLADEFGIRFIRYPREKILLSNILSTFRGLRLAQQIALNLFCIYSRKLVRYRAVDQFYGFYEGGSISVEYLEKILTNCAIGVSEIMCHPGKYVNGSTKEKYSHWNYRWDQELACLSDDKIMNCLKREKVRLISFAAIEKKR